VSIQKIPPSYDPIVRKFELPYWLVKIKEDPAVRRMMSIRQLGLKGYIDFPGAIHVRYSHALGVMVLANKTTDFLINKMNEKGNRSIKDSLKLNRDTLIAAGFFHDIGHGPFSHTVDFAMQKISGKTHEDYAEDVLTKYLPSDLENSINIKQVVKLIQNKHDYPFLSQIIDGPLDVDKLDYLLRDAYYVGLNYRFDLDYFLDSYTILGDPENLNSCKLGIENTIQARASAELFLVLWKNMYDLVYHIEASRIAEKMLEKAILLNKDNSEIKNCFCDIERFVELTDDELLKVLSQLDVQTVDLIKGIKSGKIYSVIIDKELDQKQFKMPSEFLNALKTPLQISEISDTLSKQLNQKLEQTDYTYIVDIIGSRAPKEIPIDLQDEKTGEYAVLREKSPIIGAIQETKLIKVYANNTIKKNIDETGLNTLKAALGEIVEGFKVE